MEHFPYTFSPMIPISIQPFHVLSYFLISFTPEVLSICFYLVDSFRFPNLKNWNPNFIQELKFVQVGYSFCFLFKVESLIAKDSLRYHLSSVVSLLTCCLFVTLSLFLLLLLPIIVVVSLVCVLVTSLVVSLLWKFANA